MNASYGNDIIGKMDPTPDDEQVQTWHAPRGPKTRWVARLILLLIALSVIAMIVLVFTAPAS